MKHLQKGRTFGRKRDARDAFLNSLAEALVTREKIVTTEARAKEVRPFVERLVTRGKSGTVSARRSIAATLGGRERVSKKIVEVLAPRYTGRAGGYTRIVKLAKRSGDGRQSAIIEFI